MKIVIFTGNLDFKVRWNVGMLAAQFPAAEFTILLHAPSRHLRHLLGNQVRNFRRHGWRWLPYQGLEFASLLARRGGKAPPQSADRPGQMFSAHALASHSRVRIEQFASINGEGACELVRDIAPDLGVALGAPILKECLFGLPRLGTINLHKGRLPDYRGMPPAFWELHAGESSVGCTVHRVEAGLDVGDIVLEDSVAVDRFSTVAGVQQKLHHLGVRLVCRAVALIMEGGASYTKQTSGGRTNTRPPLALEASFKRTLAKREPRENAVKGLLKHALFSCYAGGLMPIVNYVHGLRKRQRVIILLYHRVSDEFRDHVTIGIERFDQHMAYVAQHFTVLSLQQIVDGDFPRDSAKPLIGVSFDDGYRDNFDNAAPILMKHQVPCTFFISTEKVRDNQPFDHDLRALGFGLANMSWDQARQMRDWGFQFGSHTRNHVNLAEVSDQVAQSELRGSLDDLREQLSLEDVYIAFPYGRKKHITAERVDMMKQIGYKACFSAYGGLNTESMDRFDIQRIGVNWAFNLATLRARLHGWDRTR